MRSTVVEIVREALRELVGRHIRLVPKDDGTERWLEAVFDGADSMPLLDFLSLGEPHWENAVGSGGANSHEYHAGESFTSNTDMSLPHNIENRSGQVTEVVLVEIPKD